ncbi:Thiol:disulfide interchange protein DsbD precursor [Rickettsiales bacterium Ac37b]|nr:Thiol:disulfide interchange protein DsbD precursor [Rickettsiales bacterium Ac37b]
MHIVRKIIILLILFSVCLSHEIVNASNYVVGKWLNAPHSQLRLLTKELKIFEDNAHLNLELHFDIENDWYIYWYKDEKIGIPTSIKIIEPFLARITDINWPNPMLQVNNHGLTSHVYRNKVIIPISIIMPQTEVKDLQLAINYLVCGESCIPVMFDLKVDTLVNDITDQEFTVDNESYNYYQLLLVILTAFLGGVILNVMPCVLPVLSLKLLAIINHQNAANKLHQRLNFLASSIGIVMTFVGLGVFTILMSKLGKTVGWGIQFTNPLFIIFLVVIMMLFACNLLGVFSINISSKFLNYFPGFNPSNTNLTRQMMNNFASGVIATILATPCSAPFLGTAVSFALSQGSIEILIIFFSLGCGMALPYFILIIFPSCIKYLPKPGPWMLKVKYVLGILLLMTVLWLLYIVYIQLGIKAAIVLFLLCILFKFVLETNSFLLKYIPIKFLIAFLIMFYMFYIPMKIADYDSIHKDHIDLVWQEFNKDAILKLVANGNVVVVDITAEWCIICQMNKYTVLNREKLLEIFRDNKIVAMRANLTDKNRKEIMDYMKGYNRFGLPFNIVYGPRAIDGILLSELLTFHDLINAINQAKR